MTMHYTRLMKLDLPSKQSVFLWGPRQTGKSTFLHANFATSHIISLLDTALFLAYIKTPHLFREHIESLPEALKQQPIIVDEIQKIPLLLNEVHYLIERDQLSFILCGSSARKLKQVGVNLLGGRAWRIEFFPLVSQEIPDFSLLNALSKGLIPSHYLASHAERHQNAYIENYLRDEIQVEGLVRNLPAFAKFLDVVGYTHGGLVNYSNIASDVGVSGHTIKEYFQILVDTLLGRMIYPYRKKVSRQIISSMPKFYLFDVGIANFLAKKTITTLSGQDAGAAFEHFILMELVAYRGLKEKRFDIHYWRTNSGLEVDFILGQGDVAIEVKISQEVKLPMLNGLQAFMQEHQPKHAIVVSQDIAPRHLQTPHGTIYILPWSVFLAQLWNADFI